MSKNKKVHSKTITTKKPIPDGLHYAASQSLDKGGDEIFSFFISIIDRMDKEQETAFKSAFSQFILTI